jgi:hypothetical protein
MGYTNASFVYATYCQSKRILLDPTLTYERSGGYNMYKSECVTSFSLEIHERLLLRTRTNELMNISWALKRFSYR